MGVLVRCQTPPVVSLGENSKQIFGWKQREDAWNGMMMIRRIAQPPSDGESSGEQFEAVLENYVFERGGGDQLHILSPGGRGPTTH